MSPVRLAVALLALCLAASPKPLEAQAQADPYRLIAAARAHLAAGARGLWTGWERTPFGIVLVDGEQEHLLCDARSPSGFGPAATEPVTGCTKRTRPRTFPPGLQAALAAFGPPSVVVVGTPAATRRSEPAWTATLLHEHFHQHQAAAPGYYERVRALGLDGGDQTGMWMLQYAFPYEDKTVAARFFTTGQALAAALSKPRDRTRRRVYLTVRAALAASVPERDWRYAEFQMWQEGVARWTEIAAAESSPDPAVREAGRALRWRTLEELMRPDLARDKRVALYALGAGEAMLLEACGSDWRTRYLDHLAMAPLVQPVADQCRFRRTGLPW